MTHSSDDLCIALMHLKVCLRKMKTNHARLLHCIVCGDKASGVNYSAVSCESCKVFFLRYSTKKFKCLKLGNCDIDIATRKSCQSCRLQKCFAAGMRKHHQPDDPVTILPKVDVKTEPIDCLRTLLRMDTCKVNKSKVVLLRRPKTSLFQLEPYEEELIRKIEGSVSAVFTDERNLPVVGEVTTIASSIMRHDYPSMYLRRIVRFCKSMSPFQQLSRPDQLTILRQFVLEILAVRAAFIFDRQQNGYPIIKDEEGTRALFVRLQSPVILRKHEKRIMDNRKFGHLLKIEMQDDSTIRDLIITVLLFQPRDGLTCPEFISYQYSIHCRLLRKYLQHKFTNMYKAMRKYTSLINLIQYMSVIKENYRILCSEHDPTKLPEIFMEVFNLKAQ